MREDKAKKFASKRGKAASHKMPDGTMMSGATHSTNPYLAGMLAFMNTQNGTTGAAGPTMPLDKRSATSQDIQDPKLLSRWLQSRALASEISNRYLKNPSNFILPTKKEDKNGMWGEYQFDPWLWEHDIYFNPRINADQGAEKWWQYETPKNRKKIVAHEAGHAYDEERQIDRKGLDSYGQTWRNFNKKASDADVLYRTAMKTGVFPTSYTGSGIRDTDWELRPWERYANDFADSIGYPRQTGGRPAATMARMRKAGVVPKRKMPGR